MNTHLVYLFFTDHNILLYRDFSSFISTKSRLKTNSRHSILFEITIAFVNSQSVRVVLMNAISLFEELKRFFEIIEELCRTTSLLQMFH